MDKRIIRILDANINRAKEGLRVVEDLLRYYYDNKEYSGKLKEIRHEVESLIVINLKQSDLQRLDSRDSMGDVGLKIKSESEQKRTGLKQIFLSNIRRVSEALRSLEEYSKLYSNVSSLGYKSLRYEIYDLEKNIYLKVIDGYKK